MNLPQDPDSQKPGIGKKIRFVIRLLKPTEKVAIGFTFLIGVVLFQWGIYIQHQNPGLSYGMEAFAVIITIESIANTINNSISRHDYLKELANVIIEQLRPLARQLIDETTLTLSEKMKEVELELIQSFIAIKNVSSLGVSNLFKSFDLKKILELQRTNYGGVIVLQRLFFSDYEFKVLLDMLYPLIVRSDKTLLVLFQSPSEINLNMDDDDDLIASSKQTKDMTASQLKRLEKLKLQLPEKKRNNLQLKSHENYDIVSLTGFGDKLIHSSYLCNRIIDTGIYIEVRGKSSDLYKEWFSHFSLNWKNATEYTSRDKPSNPEFNSRIGHIKTLEECLKENESSDKL